MIGVDPLGVRDLLYQAQEKREAMERHIKMQGQLIAAFEMIEKLHKRVDTLERGMVALIKREQGAETQGEGGA